MTFRLNENAWARRQRKQQAQERAGIAIAIERATEFTATIFSRGGHLTERFATLDEARSAAPALESRVANGRKALVYAISPEGFTHLIPDWF